MGSGSVPRMTLSLQLVLQVLLESRERELYGLEIGTAAGLASGTIHPLLARLEGLDWVESRWEDIDPRAQGRPARRYYRLTAVGVERASAALARAHRPRGALIARPVGQE